MNRYIKLVGVAVSIVCAVMNGAMAIAQEEDVLRARDLRQRISNFASANPGGFEIQLSTQDVNILNAALMKYDESRPFETQMINPQNIEPSELAETLRIFDAEFVPNDDVGALLIHGPKSQMAAILEIVERLDANPPKIKGEDAIANIELTIHLIQGSGAKSDGDVGTTSIPNILADVITELSEVFNYGQYRLVDSLFLRCRDNSEASTSGMLPSGSGESNDAFYNFSVDSVRVTGGDPIGIRLDDVSFGATIPMTDSVQSPAGARPAIRRVNNRDIGMQADIDVREGQQVVVGKASVSGDDSALFVVISANVVGG